MSTLENELEMPDIPARGLCQVGEHVESTVEPKELAVEVKIRLDD